MPHCRQVIRTHPPRRRSGVSIPSNGGKCNRQTTASTVGRGGGSSLGNVAPFCDPATSPRRRFDSTAPRTAERVLADSGHLQAACNLASRSPVGRSVVLLVIRRALLVCRLLVVRQFWFGGGRVSGPSLMVPYGMSETHFTSERSVFSPVLGKPASPVIRGGGFIVFRFASCRWLDSVAIRPSV